MNYIKSDLQLTSILNLTDWLVFFAILLITVAAVIHGHRLQKKSAKTETESILDYLLMGRRLTLPFFVATLVATWYGGIFGVTQIAFEEGIYNFITQGVFWYITYLIFALWLVPKIRRYQAITLPDLVSQIVGPKSAKLSAIFNVANVIPISYAISLGLLLQGLFGFSLLFSTTLGMLFVLSYSWFGGFRSIVFSDLIQFFVMCSAVVLVLIFSITSFGGIGFLWEKLPHSHFNPLGSSSLLTTFVWGFIALSTLVDPNFYQRCFAGESDQVVKKGILISTLIWFCFDICTTLGGMYARAVIPDADSSKAYLYYALQILPSGLRGFVLAGIAATILSTIDSYIFVASTSITHDLLPTRFRHKKIAYHCSLLAVAFISILFSFAFAGNIRKVWLTIGSYSAACLLFPLLLCYILPKPPRDIVFFRSSLAGAITITIWQWTDHSTWGWLATIDAFYIGLVTTMLLLIPTLFIGPSEK